MSGQTQATSRRRVAADPVPRVLLRIPEFAAAAGISRAAVYNLLGTGELKSVKLGGSRRVPFSELQRLADGAA